MGYYLLVICRFNRGKFIVYVFIIVYSKIHIDLVFKLQKWTPISFTITCVQIIVHLVPGSNEYKYYCYIIIIHRIMINTNYVCFLRFYCSFPRLVHELHQQACTPCHQVVVPIMSSFGFIHWEYINRITSELKWLIRSVMMSTQSTV